MEPNTAAPVAEGLPQGIKPSKRERAQAQLRDTGKLVDTPKENGLDIARALIGKPDPISPPGTEPDAASLNGSLPQEGGAGDGQGGDPDNQQQQRPTLKDLANKLEVKTADLYNVEVGIGGDADHKKTIGELKDFYLDNHVKAERLANLDRLEVAHTTEKMTTIRDLDQLVGLLPPQALSKEYLAAVQQQAQVMARAETQKLLQVLPDFAKPEIFHAAQTAMIETAQAYGLTDADVSNIVDHRWLVALNDLAKLKGLQLAASAAKPVPRTPDRKPATSNPITAAQASAAAVKRKAKQGDRNAQISAISNLIK
jgi:hypothetical protein